MAQADLDLKVTGRYKLGKDRPSFPLRVLLRSYQGVPNLQPSLREEKPEVYPLAMQINGILTNQGREKEGMTRVALCLSSQGQLFEGYNLLAEAISWFCPLNLAGGMVGGGHGI